VYVLEGKDRCVDDVKCGSLKTGLKIIQGGTKF
jgi:hypothetical protein